MSDTPMTDEAQFGTGRVSVDFARTLERELTEARQIASKYYDRYFATRELLTVSTELAERLERELNEARTRIKRLEEALSLFIVDCDNLHHSKKHQHGFHDPCPVVDLILDAKEAKP